MDWYEEAYEAAEYEHDPEDWEGREWHELTDDERNDAAYDVIFGRADAAKDEAKERAAERNKR